MPKEQTDPNLTMGDLSSEEIAALKDAGELPPEYKDHPAALADGDDGADAERLAAEQAAKDEAAAAAGDDGGKDDKGDPADAAGAADAQNGRDDGPLDQQAAAGDEDDTFVPVYRADPKRLEEIDSRLGEVTEANNDLRKKLSEGDCSLDEYLSEKDKIDAERIDLIAEKRDLERASQQSADAQEQLWERQQAAFFRRDENAVFREDADPVMFEALNRQFVILANKYAEEGAARTGPQLLEEAAQKMRERFGLGGAGEKPADPDKARSKAAAERARQARSEQERVPKTLGDTPSASAADDSLDGDEFAELDAILDDPDRAFEAEIMIARMSPAQQARYGTVRSR